MSYTGTRVDKTYQYLSKNSNWLHNESYDREVIESLISFIIVQHLQQWRDIEEPKKKNER